MNVEGELVKAAANVARANPSGWNTLMQLLQGYSALQIQQLVQSPLDSLQLAQGRAQAVARLHGLLSECVASADKMESKQK